MKMTVQVIGRSMASLVVLNLTEIKDVDRVPFLFGPTVESFAERFMAAQNSPKAMRHFLPKHFSSSSAPSCPKLRRLSSLQSLLPLLPLQPEPRHHSCSARRFPFPKCQGPHPKIALDPVPQASS
ncbi:hypothetical protein QQF64_002536 [Cirrhinus molitorella]|uniref:Uncharacterized protein n=1 Tax=Cirrhinus molitorella TaxID=172907 RepID=A0ABR3MQH0_9TELE